MVRNCGLKLNRPRCRKPCFKSNRQYSLPKTIEFLFVLSNAIVDTVRVRINAIPFISFEADVRSFEIRTTK